LKYQCSFFQILAFSGFATFVEGNSSLIPYRIIAKAVKRRLGNALIFFGCLGVLGFRRRWFKLCSRPCLCQVQAQMIECPYCNMGVTQMDAHVACCKAAPLGSL